ncbi:MAG: Ig-like domain-containing protein [Planctomycetaceae bacterium]|jgi:hypothetical protein|nr:Ig-like domain-containing protein [Planctomycetaceae bacterium]
MYYQFFVFHFVLCCSLVFVGCNNKPTGFPDVFPCTVTVKDGERPVCDATVKLIYDSQGSITVTGVTDQSGIAQMKSIFASYEVKGVPAGDARVIIIEGTVVPETKTDAEKRAMSPEEAEAYKQERAKKMDAMPREVPEVLENAQTTPIRISVEKSGTTLTVDISKYK